LEIRPSGNPRAGEVFEFVVSSKRRLAQVGAYIGRYRLWEASFIDSPVSQTIRISHGTAGQTLRIFAVDAIGNNVEDRRKIAAAAGWTVDGDYADGAET
jgi:hypothetical protein